MLVTREMLRSFGACKDASNEFEKEYPDGLDISGLWGTFDQANETWRGLLANEFLRQYIGWAIWAGMLPARIRADLSRADLSRANLSWANLSEANLSWANLREAIWNEYTTWPEGYPTNDD